MKLLIAAGLVFASSVVFAQSRTALPVQAPAAAPQPTRSAHPAPAVRTPAASHPYSITDPTFAGRLAATVGAFGLPESARRPTPGSRRSGGGVYAFPVYVGGGYGYDYAAQPMAPAPPPTVNVYVPPQPPVIINQNFGPGYAPPAAPDTVQVYQNPAPQPAVETTPSSSYYLLAFKDNSISSALAYWVQGDTLHYFTAGNVHNQVSLSLVDREMTDRLNKDRDVKVDLPR